MKAATTWMPTLVLGLAAVFTVGMDTQREVPLQEPLGAVLPEQINGFAGRDVTISDDELRVAGVTDYLMRSYEPTEETSRAGSFSLYIGYYNGQMRGKTIHSPKNCLPGAGWQTLASTESMVPTERGSVTVNRYLLQKDDLRVLVLYWYQGRGRVRANEYHVKWDLLRDAALHKRTEEALVRIVVPIDSSEAQSFDLAARVAATVAQMLDAALPAWN
jgi:EpsI family protein